MKFNTALKLLATLLLVFLLLFTITKSQWSSEMAEGSSMKEVGEVLFNEYYLPFVLISLLLAAAMLGSVYIAKERD
jgi:NADH:ubiquinone oxidoreductase subunit 6 (subunit J)